MNKEQIVKSVSKFFGQLGKCISSKDIASAYNLLGTPQPIEWRKSSPSQFHPGEDYYWNEVELTENLFDLVFPFSKFDIVSHQVIQDKGRFSSTVVVKLEYGFLGFEKVAIGSASEFAQDIQWLTLATPSSIIKAKTSAIRSIGEIFGKSLNRGLENIPVIQVNAGAKYDEEFQRILKHIEPMSKEDAAAYVATLNGWTLNAELKKIINSKK